VVNDSLEAFTWPVVHHRPPFCTGKSDVEVVVTNSPLFALVLQQEWD